MADRKITFVGDIMCEPLLMKASKTKEGYDFNSVFSNIKGMFTESDYVIGNLETPLAGAVAGYTDGLFSFNTPDEFVDAMKTAGIKLVTTANNHCLDRGIEGLERTNKILKEKQISFTGTYSSDFIGSRTSYFSFDGIKYAVIAYTYGTNFFSNHILLNDSQKNMVNLLRPQDELYYIPKNMKKTLRQRIFIKFLRLFKEERRYYIKKALGKTVNVAHADDNLNKESSRPYIEKMQKDICNAKKNADVVFFCPHVGGQFNQIPGAFSEYVFHKSIEAGCDAIVASHAHVIQKAEYIKGVPCFFSLGNFSMSPNSIYLLHEYKPEYGLAVHFYINGKTIDKITFSILKIIEDKNTALTVIPVDKLYTALNHEKEKMQLLMDIEYIYQVVVGYKMENVKVEKEYVYLQGLGG